MAHYRRKVTYSCKETYLTAENLRGQSVFSLSFEFLRPALRKILCLFFGGLSSCTRMN